MKISLAIFLRAGLISLRNLRKLKSVFFFPLKYLRIKIIHSGFLIPVK